VSSIFPRTLRELRQASGTSQRKTAHAIGVTSSYLSAVESGKEQPLAHDKVLQVAAFLGVDPRPLLIARAVDRGTVETKYLCDESFRDELLKALGC